MTFNIDKNLCGKSGIYSITNSIDHRIYIGSSINFRRRHQDHKSRLIRKTHVNKYLQSFVNKYGIELLSFNLLCLCKNTCLIYNEQRLIKEYDANNPRMGFNLKEIVNRPFFEDQILFELRSMQTPLGILFPNGMPGFENNIPLTDEESPFGKPSPFEEKVEVIPKTTKIKLSKYPKERKRQLKEMLKSIRENTY